MNPVERLLDSWGDDQTCDTPRDAKRMQQLVTLARQLAASEQYWHARAKQYAVDRFDLYRYEWLLDKFVYQNSGPHYGWTFDELIDGDDAYDALCRAYDKAMKADTPPEDYRDYQYRREVAREDDAI